MTHIALRWSAWTDHDSIDMPLRWSGRIRNTMMKDVAPLGLGVGMSHVL